MKVWVLRLHTILARNNFFTGDIYNEYDKWLCENHYYPGTTSDIEKAKQYKSEKEAYESIKNANLDDKWLFVAVQKDCYV